MDSQPRRRIAGRYLLLESIGQGGMGVVWKAHDELIDRTVAVKEVLHRAISDEDRENFNRRTIREARAAGRLSHPNVVVVHDVIEEDGRPWIVMQLVDARSLGDVIKAHGPLTPERVAAIGLQVLDALRTAHRAGVLHRDVKPENVLLGDDGRVVLTDFGIATMTQETALTMTGGISGTPAFMPPERLNGLPAVPESDLWSLGATLYAAVEGRPPFDRGAPVPTMAAVLHDQPQPMRRAGPLAPVIDGLLRKDPAQRMDSYQAEELLRRAAAGDEAGAWGAGTGPAPGGGAFGGAGAHGGTAPGRLPDAPSLPSPGAPGAPWPAPGGPSPPWQSGANAPTFPEGHPGARPAPPARPRGGLIALAVGVPIALVVVGAAAWYALSSSPEVGPGSTPSAAITTSGPAGSSPPGSPVPESPTPATPSPESPSPGTGEKVKVPPGWRLHKDRGGFSIALPRGWTEFQRAATSVKFRGPGSSGYLQIDWTVAEDPVRDPVRAWETLEKRVLDERKLPGYRRLRIEQVEYLGREAADWEFTWRLSSGTAHVLDRGFRTADDKPFAIYWQTLDGAWQRDLRFLRGFLSTFRPA